jgi:arsenate reductase
VLFVCTGNSARSQMAEALLRARGAGRFHVRSAGTRPQGINPLTIRSLAAIGIDATSHTSDHIDQYTGEPWDYVVTVCDNAAEECPVVPGAGQRLHWSFPDPAAVEGSDEQRFSAFEAVREAIDRRISAFIDAGE